MPVEPRAKVGNAPLRKCRGKWERDEQRGNVRRVDAEDPSDDERSVGDATLGERKGQDEPTQNEEHDHGCAPRFIRDTGSDVTEWVHFGQVSQYDRERREAAN